MEHPTPILESHYNRLISPNILVLHNRIFGQTPEDPRYINKKYVDELCVVGMQAEKAWRDLRQKFLDLGIARYHPKTGKWEWLDVEVIQKKPIDILKENS